MYVYSVLHSDLSYLNQPKTQLQTVANSSLFMLNYAQSLINFNGSCTNMHNIIKFNYSAPVGVRRIVMNPSVCASVCFSVREHSFGTAGPIFTKFCMQISCDRGSVLFWRRCDTLCTSGFRDDVTFGRNGQYGETWIRTTTVKRLRTTSGVVMPGRNVMFMNALLFSVKLFKIIPSFNDKIHNNKKKLLSQMYRVAQRFTPKSSCELLNIERDC